MRRWPLILLLAMVLAACSACSLSAANPNYFPLQAGNKWIYRTQTGQRVSMIAGQVVQMSGKQAIPVHMKQQGKVLRTDYYFPAGPAKLYWLAGSQLSFSQPRLLLQPTPAADKTWSNQLTLTGQRGADRAQVTEQLRSHRWSSYRVPAGDFKQVIEVINHSTVNKGSLQIGTTDMRWYAPGVGLIKEQVMRGTELVSDLALTQYQVQGTQ